MRGTSTPTYILPPVLCGILIKLARLLYSARFSVHLQISGFVFSECKTQEKLVIAI